MQARLKLISEGPVDRLVALDLPLALKLSRDDQQVEVRFRPCRNIVAVALIRELGVNWTQSTLELDRDALSS
jgi:hypothetical protein